jgi:NodT family efflux transporter outer membrane factor (OMF) lipoprotein
MEIFVNVNDSLLNSRQMNVDLIRIFFLYLPVSIVFCGCVAGPDFKSPVAPSSVGNKYTPETLPSTTEVVPGSDSISQHIAYGEKLPAQWWTLFHSEALDQLIRSALQQNPTFSAAQATLRQAKESFNAESGSLMFPSVSAQAGATREQAQLYSATPSVLNLYNASVNISYNLDVFGASHRQLESMLAVVDYQHFELEAAYQMLASNVVTTAIREALMRAQLQATQSILDAQQKQLAVIEKQLSLGAVTRSVELLQRTLVAQTEALLPPLEKSLVQTRHQLAVYVGKLPGESGLPEFQLDNLQLPPDLPVSLPSSLVRQRPDIRASEALLHQASALIGVAAANQYPQFNLTGSYTYQNIQLGSVSASSPLWSLGAGLTQPIFNAGALKAKRRAAEAAYDQAEAEYRWTVLTAFQNVADNLRAIDSDAATYKAQANAESLARESMELSQSQYQLGAVSFLTVLDTQRSYQQAHINLVTAQAARLTDTAALFVALGGGWWNRTEENVAKDKENTK